MRMWPFTKRRANTPLPKRVTDWPATLPEEALAAGDRDLIRHRWTRALDQGFRVAPEMQAAFQTPPLRFVAPRDDSRMSDKERDLAAFASLLDLSEPHDQIRRLRASVAVLVALDLPEQSEKLVKFIEWTRVTGAGHHWRW